MRFDFNHRSFGKYASEKLFTFTNIYKIIGKVLRLRKNDLRRYYFENMHNPKYFEAGCLNVEAGCLIMIVLRQPASKQS